MPIELGQYTIAILDNTGNTSNIIETVKYTGQRDGDTVVNVPVVTGGVEPQPYYETQLPLTEYTVLDADADHLKVWYKFDDDFNDSSGNGHNALLYTGQTPVISTTQYKIGKSAYFTNDKLIIDGFTLHNKSFSVSVWSYATEGGVILSQQKATATNQNLHIRVATSGSNVRYDFHFWANDLLSAQIYPDLNNWVHLVFQIHSNGNKEIWRNGVRIANDLNTSFLNTDNADLVLGNWNYSNDYYGSYLDDFRIYDRALTPTEIGYLANNMIVNPEYKYLTFTYQNDDLVYDFSPYDDLTSWNTYASSIGATYYNTSFSQGGVYHHPGNGWIELVLPNGYDFVSIFYGNPHTGGTTILYIDGVQKSSCSAGITTTYSQSYTGGQTLKILESSGIIHPDLKITLSKTQTPYTLTFDNPTECDILIVAGGGGGGKYGAGGGGGDVQYFNNIELNGSYTVKVGKGGNGSTTHGTANQNATNGVNSEIILDSQIIYISAGGGAGTSWDGDDTGGIDPLITYTSLNNSSTGAGGGGAANHGTGSSFGAENNSGNPIISTHSGNGGGGGSYGDNIGSGDVCIAAGGGGGGGPQGQNGQNAYMDGTSDVNSKSGNGGNGTSSTLTGVEVYYGGGGGGGGSGGGGTINSKTRYIIQDGIGGLGGGGNGSTTSGSNNAQNNTGGGGGGGSANDGGAGGSGIVIIRYKQQYNQVPYNAQWTYSSTDPTVHHYGNVGIGTTAHPSTALTIKGDVNVIGNYFNDEKMLFSNPWYEMDNKDIYKIVGNVGIGTHEPQYKLHIQRELYANNGGFSGNGSTSWSTTSDRRIKENVVEASYDLCFENIKNINLYKFNYAEKFSKTTKRTQFGFVAQEVQNYYPKAVQERKIQVKDNLTIKNLLTVDVTQLNYTLYGAVKHFVNEVDKIKSQLGIIDVVEEEPVPETTEEEPVPETTEEEPVINVDIV